MHSRRFLIIAGVLSFAAWMLWPLVAVQLGERAPSAELPAAHETPAGNPAESRAGKTKTATAPERIAEKGAQTEAAWSTPHSQEVPLEDAAFPTANTAQEIGAQNADAAPELSISGRVLTTKGTPVPGIAVVASRLDPGGRPASAEPSRGRSDESGKYEIRGLTPGDYRLRTVESAGYAAAGGTFRAGVESADIVLAASSTVQVFGTVTAVGGQPLAQVEVMPRTGQDTRQVWTDNDGNYRTQVSVGDPAATYTFWFRLADYEEKRVHLQGRELASAGQLRVDVELQPEREMTTVSGTLQSSRGDPVPGERVQLHSDSSAARHSTTSRPDGTFSMPAVEPGSDYRVTIYPKGPYENYFQQGVMIGGSTAYLDITLQALESGRLTGRMVDVDGYPIPGFSLLLKATAAQNRRIPVTSDDGGYFVVEDAPAGTLMFVSLSEPRFLVSGITLPAGTAHDVELVIDWGDHELSGRVRDGSQAPVAGAEIRLSWQHVAGGAHSSSLRRARTDNEGAFRFTQLGGGPHQLEVTASGYQPVKQIHTVDSYVGLVEVKLRAVSQPGN